MEKLHIHKDSDQFRLVFLLLSIVTALLYLNSEGSIFIFMLALVLLSFSNAEKAENAILRAFAGVTYTIFFLWIIYKVFLWMYSNFLA